MYNALLMERFAKETPPQDKITLLRHLKDINDLRNNRDSGIEAGQEQAALEVANRIAFYAKERGAKAIIIFSSTKNRATESAELVREKLRSIDHHLKIILSPSVYLSDLDHGEFILPENYVSGDHHDILQIAWDAFITESFTENNPNYRYGDPIVKEDGTAKYSELVGQFTRFGESQIDSNIRIYKAIVNGYENRDRIFPKNILSIVLTHSLVYAILKNLSIVAKRVRKENFNFKKGTLYKVCWDVYNNEKESQHKSQYGDFLEIPIDLLEDKKFVGLLKEEITFFEEEAMK